MRKAGGALFAASAACVLLLAVADLGIAAGHEARAAQHARLITDGRLRPGHLETMSVAGFPGAGRLEISFSPTAICEGDCGGRSFQVGRTNARGAAKFRVRVPATFINRRGGYTYFRDRERVEVIAFWEGSGPTADVAYAEPEPIIVRTHDSRPAAPAPWARGSATPGVPLPIPGAFRVPGTNGYTPYVIGAPPHHGTSGSLVLEAVAKGMGVTYRAPATVTETSMQADLGDLGEISVTFRRSNRPAAAQCGKQAVRFDSGVYEGTVDFRGEDGYTSVEATSAPGNADLEAAVICGEGFTEVSPSRRPRGADLYLRNPALGPGLSVHKSRPGAAALISASTSEYTNGIAIRRFERRWMPSRDFTYDRRLRTATVEPPAPFAGSGRFDLGKKAGRRWSGDLTVDLPGSSAVPLTGPALRAFLVPSE